MRKGVKHMKKTQKAFTLIELLVVVAIIAILALIVMLALNPVEMARRSRDSRRLSDMATLRKAIDLSLADGAVLPAAGSRSTSGGGTKLDCTDATNNLVGMDICKYLSTIPQDPRATAAEATKVADGDCTTTTGSVAAGSMIYTFITDGDTYEVNSYMESMDNCKVLSGDGGSNDDIYELGTKIK